MASRTPKLTAEILSLWWNKARDNHAAVFVQIQIVNSGGSQSIARGYSVSALSNGMELIGHNEHIADGISLTNKYGQIVQPTPRLYETTTQPILEGGQAGGWMLFVFDATLETVRNTQTTLVFKFMDAKGQCYTATCSATGDGIEGEVKYYPGAGTPPRPLAT